jgi:predicted dienelactone hydrolase
MRNAMRFLAVMLFVASLMALAGRVAVAETIGVREIAVLAPERSTSVQATVWYPTHGAGTPVLVGDNAVFRGIPALRNSPVARGLFPLVLIAHGGFRAAPNTASWLASALVAKGYIAVVMQPPLILHGPPPPAILQELWLRPADMSATLTAIEKEPEFTGRIDPSKVAGIGFFLGGYAVLELAGARVDAAAYERFCDGIAAGPDCAWFARGGVDLHTVDAAQLERSNHDPRVKAAVVVDPELTGTLTSQSLGSVGIPVHIVNLGAQGRIPAALNASAIATHLRGTTYETMTGATSFSSFPECKPDGVNILKNEGGEVQLCDDRGTRTRASIHKDLAAVIETALQQSFGTSE